MAAVGLNRLIRLSGSSAVTLLVFLVILSVSVEGPIPFLNLQTHFPFIVPKDSLNPYSTIISKSQPPSKEILMFYNDLTGSSLDFSFGLEDQIFFLSLVFPLIIDLILQKMKEHTREGDDS